MRQPLHVRALMWEPADSARRRCAAPHRVTPIQVVGAARRGGPRLQAVCARSLALSRSPPPPFLCFSPKTEHNFSHNPTLDPVLSPVLPCTEEKGRKAGGREEVLRATSLPAAIALSCPRYDVVVIFPALPSPSNRHLSLLLLQIYMHHF